MNKISLDYFKNNLLQVFHQDFKQTFKIHHATAIEKIQTAYNIASPFITIYYELFKNQINSAIQADIMWSFTILKFVIISYSMFRHADILKLVTYLLCLSGFMFYIINFYWTMKIISICKLNFDFFDEQPTPHDSPAESIINTIIDDIKTLPSFTIAE